MSSPRIRSLHRQHVRTRGSFRMWTETAAFARSFTPFHDLAQHAIQPRARRRAPRARLGIIQGVHRCSRLPALRAPILPLPALSAAAPYCSVVWQPSWLVAPPIFARSAKRRRLKSAHPPLLRARPLRLLRLVRHLLHRLLRRPLRQALRAAHPARHAYPYLRTRSSRVGKSTPAP